MTTTMRDIAVGELWNTIELAKSVARNFRARTTREGANVNDHSLSLEDVRMWLMCAVEHPSRRGRKPLVNVQAMVDAWVPIVRGLSTAHEKAAVDRCEFDMETHLLPMLAAPVKQLREFYAALVVALKADPTIPFFVWAMFQSWGDVILKHAPDGEVRELKTALATEIANLVEADVRPDVPKAIAAALQWRSPETLEKIRDHVKHGGQKAKLTGKESCLFLEVAGEMVML